MSTFEFANQALRRDLSAYADSLSTIVENIPRARDLCESVLKEMQLAQALLAFASGPSVSELGQIIYQLRNLWPYRERAYARTVGFSEEIAEAKAQRDEALRAQRLLSRNTSDPLLVELAACMGHAAAFLDEERQLLEACHAQIQPHALNMDLTRKRLDLLIAAIDARVPAGDDQRSTLESYRAAADILRDWDSGVPIDSEGVAILARCIAHLEGADHSVLALLSAPRRPRPGRQG